MTQKRSGLAWLSSALLILLLATAPARYGAADSPPPSPATSSPAASSLTPEQTRAALEVLGDPHKREDLIRVLQALPANAGSVQPAAPAAALAVPSPASVEAAPAASPAASPAVSPAAGDAKADGKPAPAKPDASAAAKDAKADAAAPGLAPNSLGMALVKSSVSALSGISEKVTQSVRTVAEAPLFYYWLQGQISQPERRIWLMHSLVILIAVMTAGGLAAWGTARILAPLRTRLAAPKTETPKAETPAGAEAAEATGPQSTGPQTTGTEAMAVKTASPSLTDIEGANAGEADDIEDDDIENSGIPGSSITAEEETARQHAHAARVLSRLPLITLAALLNLLPVGAFFLVTNGLLWALAKDDLSAPATACINATAFGAMALSVLRVLLAPDARRLRLLRLQDSVAQYCYRWIRRIVIIATVGAVIAGIARSLGLYSLAVEAILKITALFIHISLIAVVLQKRRAVAAWLLHGAEGNKLGARLRRGIASFWHWPAIIILAAFWLIWALEMENGLTRLTHGAIVAVCILTGARVASLVLLGLMDRSLHLSPDAKSRHPEIGSRLDRYYPIVRRTASAALLAATVILLLQAWGVPTVNWFVHGGIGGRLVSALITIGITIVAAIFLWESINITSERHLARLTAQAQFVRTARLRTLLPMFRTALLTVISAIVVLTVLSEIGVNIAPLLAGAGIMGVAIGFGSQKLVQDLITGIFLLLENAMQVGDSVTLGGLSGTVEHLSIRTIRLRASDGSVHIIPFSAVSTVTNVNRGVGNASVNVTVDISEDPDRAGQILKDIAAAMRKDDDFSARITGDLALWGVDSVDASGITLAGQIPCTDSGRWAVQREFNRRVHLAFQQAGIRLAVPRQALTILDMPAIAGAGGGAA